ncbi:DNA cytosine methyltransferase [Streptosporangium sp. NBC_01755]|uniref:DNA cytosine methyltransferase n=1 Tax=Streptosporangium sp. NBC_01755 TaxID=2975949 RepID=UPI002DDBF158|nr:DNA cytosine methyltransferase [Streptosporangium sp. NBC_01755]WSD03265.1 DNA cytosine methyltransferase [Streptosporangium sp. NBC_01755]
MTTSATLLAVPARLDGWDSMPSGLLIPRTTPPPRRRDKPIAVEFFAGAGGFSLGFKYAGWHVAAAVEWDLHAAATYLCNLGGPETIVHFDDPDRWAAWQKFNGDEKHRWVKAGAPVGFAGAGTGWIASGGHDGPPPADCTCAPCVKAVPCEQFWIADVRRLTGAEILDALGMEVGEVDAVIGGPPCQGFSASGKRDVMDPRNSLVFDYARLVLEISPKTFVMENVPGIVNMVTPEGVPVLDAFCRVLSDGGFAAYDALKRTLQAQAGSTGFVRDDNVRKSGKASRKQPSKPAQPQLDLFGEALS